MSVLLCVVFLMQVKIGAGAYEDMRALLAHAEQEKRSYVLSYFWIETLLISIFPHGIELGITNSIPCF